MKREKTRIQGVCETLDLVQPVSLNIPQKEWESILLPRLHRCQTSDDCEFQNPWQAAMTYFRQLLGGALICDRGGTKIQDVKQIVSRKTLRVPAHGGERGAEGVARGLKCLIWT